MLGNKPADTTHNLLALQLRSLQLVKCTDLCRLAEEDNDWQFPAVLPDLEHLGLDRCSIIEVCQVPAPRIKNRHALLFFYKKKQKFAAASGALQFV